MLIGGRDRVPFHNMVDLIWRVYPDRAAENHWYPFGRSVLHKRPWVLEKQPAVRAAVT
jgi:hypothetical protein